jgi:hypothetical protein
MRVVVRSTTNRRGASTIRADFREKSHSPIRERENKLVEQDREFSDEGLD